MIEADRFWRKAERKSPDECWPWLASRCGAGYGKFRSASGQIVGAHRKAYALSYGEAPAQLEVCHRCDNKRCVNPSHLFLGTRADNMGDMYRKRRHPLQKLTESIVRDACALLAAGLNQSEVGKRLGLNQTTISKIKRKKVLKHLEGHSRIEPSLAG